MGPHAAYDRRIRDGNEPIASAFEDIKRKAEGVGAVIGSVGGERFDKLGETDAIRSVTAAQREAAAAREGIGGAERTEHGLQLQLLKTQIENRRKYEGLGPDVTQREQLATLQEKVDKEREASLRVQIDQQERERSTEPEQAEAADERARAVRRNTMPEAMEAQERAGIAPRNAPIEAAGAQCA